MHFFFAADGQKQMVKRKNYSPKREDSHNLFVSNNKIKFVVSVNNAN